MVREVMAEVFEFILSIFIISGAGFLLFYGIAAELSSGMITMITVYWFQKRSNDSAVNNLLRQSPTIIPIANEFQTPPIKPETTNPTNPTNVPGRIEVDE